VAVVRIVNLLAIASSLAGCSLSYYGEASTGSSMHADYGAQWPESDPHAERGGIRHGAFTNGN
jgi:hypothetical protein